MDRSVELAIGAAVLACEDADLDLDKARFRSLWYCSWYRYWRYRLYP